MFWKCFQISLQKLQLLKLCVWHTFPFNYILNDGSHINYLLLSEFVFHDILIDGCIYMKVSLVKTPSVSFKLLKSEQSRYYFEVEAIYNDYIRLLLPMQINSVIELCENLGVNFLKWKFVTNVFMEMSNNIHKININWPVAISNFSPIKFLVP